MKVKVSEQQFSELWLPAINIKNPIYGQACFEIHCHSKSTSFHLFLQVGCLLPLLRKEYLDGSLLSWKL